MPRKKILPVIPFASVGDIVTANNGQNYLILKIDGAKAWVKHPNEDGTIGPGRPRFAVMEDGNPSDTLIPVAGESGMEGGVKPDRLIQVNIL
jgi:hypothetical protein